MKGTALPTRVHAVRQAVMPQSYLRVSYRICSSTALLRSQIHNLITRHANLYDLLVTFLFVEHLRESVHAIIVPFLVNRRIFLRHSKD